MFNALWQLCPGVVVVGSPKAFVLGLPPLYLIYFVRNHIFKRPLPLGGAPLVFVFPDMLDCGEEKPV